MAQGGRSTRPARPAADDRGSSPHRQSGAVAATPVMEVPGHLAGRALRPRVGGRNLSQEVLQPTDKDVWVEFAAEPLAGSPRCLQSSLVVSQQLGEQAGGMAGIVERPVTTFYTVIVKLSDRANIARQDRKARGHRFDDRQAERFGVTGVDVGAVPGKHTAHARLEAEEANLLR